MEGRATKSRRVAKTAHRVIIYGGHGGLLAYLLINWEVAARAGPFAMFVALLGIIVPVFTFWNERTNRSSSDGEAGVEK